MLEQPATPPRPRAVKDAAGECVVRRLDCAAAHCTQQLAATALASEEGEVRAARRRRAQGATVNRGIGMLDAKGRADVALAVIA